MYGPNLKSASVVLLEYHGATRRAVKSTLFGIGFGMVHDCRTIDEVRSAAERAKPDIFILDLDVDNDAVSSLIQDIRYSRLGENPFVVIVGMTQHPAEPVIQRILDAGTDDLVTKPLSTKLLTGRITNLIQNRKEFIATSGYLGPQRGKGVRPENEEVVQVKVPNSLRDKASGKIRTAPDDLEIKRASHAITLHRLYGLVLPIINISMRLERAVSDDSDDGGVGRHIGQLARLVSEIKAIALPETVCDLSRLTASLEHVVGALVETASPTPSQFELVRLHAQAIAATMRGDVDASFEVVAAFGEVVDPNIGNGKRAVSE